MRIAPLFSVILLLLASGVQAQQYHPETRKLTVQGQASVAAEPDMAVITVGVSRIAPTAAKALQLNSDDMQKVFSVLALAGVEQRDMQTKGLSLHPRHERRSRDDLPPKIIGFEAVNSLEIRVRALDTLGGVLDQLARAGANRLHAISFTLQEPRPYLDQVRIKATKDARNKAALFAKAAGVTLGHVLEINESFGGQPQQPQFSRRGMAADGVPIARGETQITAQVQVVFLIE